MLILYLSTFILFANCHPIQDNEETLPSTTDLIPPSIQKDINLVAYIQNFKNAMTEYVTSQYQNLTIRETERIKTIIEEFLTNFAKDLKEAVENQFKNETNSKIEHEEIQDGVPNETFADIGERVRSEFPEVSGDTAKVIVYKLRKNLLETRRRLDVIIKQSEKAQAEFELD